VHLRANADDALRCRNLDRGRGDSLFVSKKSLIRGLFLLLVGFVRVPQFLPDKFTELGKGGFSGQQSPYLVGYAVGCGLDLFGLVSHV